jgi:hypothetical protein
LCAPKPPEPLDLWIIALREKSRYLLDFHGFRGPSNGSGKNHLADTEANIAYRIKRVLNEARGQSPRS